MRSLLRSIMVGTAVGAAAPAFLGSVTILINMVVYGPLQEKTLTVVGFVVLMIGFILALVTLSSLLIGLPTAWMLRRIGAESNMAYSIIGGGAGFLLALAAGFLLLFHIPLALMVGFKPRQGKECGR